MAGVLLTSLLIILTDMVLFLSHFFHHSLFILSSKQVFAAYKAILLLNLVSDIMAKYL